VEAAAELVAGLSITCPVRMGAVIGALAASGGQHARPDPSGPAPRRATEPSDALVALFEPERATREHLAATFQALVMTAGTIASTDRSWEELVDLFLHGALTG
jgi:hypothetical protein